VVHELRSGLPLHFNIENIQNMATTGVRNDFMNLVWLDMSQEELDAAYDQAIYAPNRIQLLDRFAANSSLVRERLGEPARFHYGIAEKEGLDVYRAERDTAPVNIFIHGGAWRSGLATNYGFPAELFVKAGAHFVVPDFDWVQDCNGDLTPMADQVQRAIAWVHKNAAEFGGDPDQIYLSGHSSGAHLAGVALTCNWQKRFDIPDDVIKGALLCSGMYDLKPVRLSARSSYVAFTDESEHLLSTQRHLDRITTPIILAYGTMETPEFQRQTLEFADSLARCNHPVELLIAEGYNHFEVLETLSNPYGLLGRAVQNQMNLNSFTAATQPAGTSRQAQRPGTLMRTIMPHTRLCTKPTTFNQ
jgi:arylformamidase